MRWEDRKSRRMADYPEAPIGGWTAVLAIVLAALFAWALVSGVIIIAS